MASSLTTAQKIELFYILGTSYNGKVYKPEGEFKLSYREYTSGNLSEMLQLKIIDRLNELTAEEENYLVQKINAWQLIGMNTATIDGSVGGVNGVVYNPDNQRNQIHSAILVIIPVYQYQSEMAATEDQRNSGAGFWSPAER